MFSRLTHSLRRKKDHIVHDSGELALMSIDEITKLRPHDVGKHTIDGAVSILDGAYDKLDKKTVTIHDAKIVPHLMKNVSMKRAELIALKKAKIDIENGEPIEIVQKARDLVAESTIAGNIRRLQAEMDAMDLKEENERGLALLEKKYKEIFGTRGGNRTKFSRNKRRKSRNKRYRRKTRNNRF
jgi:hypothetical protein